MATMAPILVLPLAAEAQQAGKVWRIGFMSTSNPRVRRAWVFVMTLSCSRHQYAELVFDQTVDTWLRLHRAAFDFFGGIPRRIVLDNVRSRRRTGSIKGLPAERTGKLISVRRQKELVMFRGNYRRQLKGI